MLPMVGHTMGTSSVILYALHTMPGRIAPYNPVTGIANGSMRCPTPLDVQLLQCVCSLFSLGGVPNETTENLILLIRSSVLHLLAGY